MNLLGQHIRVTQIRRIANFSMFALMVYSRDEMVAGLGKHLMMFQRTANGLAKFPNGNWFNNHIEKIHLIELKYVPLKYNNGIVPALNILISFNYFISFRSVLFQCRLVQRSFDRQTIRRIGKSTNHWKAQN